MYLFLIVLIMIASFVLVLTVLAQNPKGGMAANFSASNQVMGARQTSDFLEKLTWGLAIAIVVLSLSATMAMPRDNINRSNQAVEQAAESTGIRSDFGTMPGASTTGTETPAATETGEGQQ